MINGIFYTDISDHLPIFSINLDSTCIHSENYVSFIYKRQQNKKNTEIFVKKIKNIPWDTVITLNDCQGAFSLFHKYFTNCYRESFPLVKIKQTKYLMRKTWLSYGLKKSIKTKNKLYVKSIKSPSLTNLKIYKTYRNKLNSLLRKAEREHYDKLLTQHKSNLSKSWKIVKDVINKNKQKTIPNTFIINNKENTDPSSISNHFNEFFANIGTNLAKNILDIDKDATSYIKYNNPSSMFNSPVLATEVLKIISSLNKASHGWDDISSQIVKTTSHLFIEPITHILNLSLIQGVFPDELKIAKIVPIYKSENNQIINNYRPVSVLPIFSKLFERVMYSRLFSFVNKHNILYKYQFGFREKHGTNLAMITLVEKILNEMDQGNIVLGLYLDLRKAFDTVNHTILLNKLNKYGVRDISLKWFHSFLSNRKQFVSYNKVNSTYRDITCGVPQGSILGPLLFLLYVNDMAYVSNLLFSILFADDTNVFISGKNIENLTQIMNNELEQLAKWLQVNKLSLNVDKTHYMIFTLKKSVDANTNIIINDAIIKRVYKTKFLGLILDSNLSWREHIKHIKSKLSKGTGILLKARKYFKISTLVTLYYSFLYPYLTYCTEVWGSANITDLNSLFKVQKRIIRIIVSAKFKEHTGPIFSKLKLLRLSELYEYSIVLFMYKYINDMLPPIFNNIFILNSDIHQYTTRQSEKFRVPKGKLSMSKRSIKYKGVLLWNNISDNIEYHHGIFTFKKQLKNYLLLHSTTN